MTNEHIEMSNPHISRHIFQLEDSVRLRIEKDCRVLLCYLVPLYFIVFAAPYLYVDLAKGYTGDIRAPLIISVLAGYSIGIQFLFPALMRLNMGKQFVEIEFETISIGGKREARLADIVNATVGRSRFPDEDILHLRMRDGGLMYISQTKDMKQLLALISSGAPIGLERTETVTTLRPTSHYVALCIGLGILVMIAALQYDYPF